MNIANTNQLMHHDNDNTKSVVHVLNNLNINPLFLLIGVVVFVVLIRYAKFMPVAFTGLTLVRGSRC